MGHIVAIGGGEIRKRETYQIDKYIVELSGKLNPNVVFVPTASNDYEGYQDISPDSSIKTNIFKDKYLYERNYLEAKLFFC